MTFFFKQVRYEVARQMSLCMVADFIIWNLRGKKLIYFFYILLLMFSALYVIHQNREWSPFSHPMQSIIGMFMMSHGCRFYHLDLFFFRSIYVLLLMFSAMYVIHQNREWSPFSHPIESIMGMFMMSLGEFGDYYAQFKQTDHPHLAKVFCYYSYWHLHFLKTQFLL
jgi:hypothetical protein